MISASDWPTLIDKLKTKEISFNTFRTARVYADSCIIKFVYSNPLGSWRKKLFSSKSYFKYENKSFKENKA